MHASICKANRLMTYPHLAGSVQPLKCGRFHGLFYIPAGITAQFRAQHRAELQSIELGACSRVSNYSILHSYKLHVACKKKNKKKKTTRSVHQGVSGHTLVWKAIYQIALLAIFNVVEHFRQKVNFSSRSTVRNDEDSTDING